MDLDLDALGAPSSLLVVVALARVDGGIVQDGAVLVL
jgi:hypothetical protein